MRELTLEEIEARNGWYAQLSLISKPFRLEGGV